MHRPGCIFTLVGKHFFSGPDAIVFAVSTCCIAVKIFSQQVLLDSFFSFPLNGLDSDVLTDCVSRL